MSLRLLLIEDSEDDALLLELELRNGGFDPDISRVETPEELESALEAKTWDAVIADYNLPTFTGLDALAIIRSKGLDLPFILVSGVIGEEKAVEAMKAGAHDYIMKGNYSRLAPALERELGDAAVRRERRQAEEALRRAHAELEQRVAERTAELQAANVTLRDSRRSALNMMEDAVAARRLAEEVSAELRKSKQRNEFLANILEVASQPFAVGYPDGRLVLANSSFEQLTGYSGDELKTINWDVILTPPEWREIERARLEELQRTGLPVRFEKEYIRKDGSRIPVELLVHFAADSEGKPGYYYAFVTDITERKQTEQALLKAKEAAEAATRAKSQFLANMSHELRTPMGGVLGMLELALGGHLEAQQREYIETAIKSGRSLLRILNDILDLSRVESGQLAIVESPFTLRECLTDTVEILSYEAQRKGIEISHSTAEDVPQTVIGDQLRLRQVLLNLIGNAVKFTEHGTVEVRVVTGKPTSSGRRDTTFSITDSGIGIPANKKEILFQSFSQVDDSHKRSYGGVGLGLAISREIVELMGGTITFESEEGVGSTFFVTVPFCEAGAECEIDTVSQEPLFAAGAAPLAEKGERQRLLIAEDDPINRKILDQVFRLKNFEPEFATNGLEAVEKWEKGIYELIVMDVQMPYMDGFEATRIIREKERTGDGHTLIVAMTAHASREDEKRCLDAGMDAFISKPIDLMKSIEVIKDLINKKTASA